MEQRMCVPTPSAIPTMPADMIASRWRRRIRKGSRLRAVASGRGRGGRAALGRGAGGGGGGGDDGRLGVTVLMAVSCVRLALGLDLGTEAVDLGQLILVGA